jgi:hypothetical protein
MKWRYLWLVSGFFLIFFAKNVFSNSASINTLTTVEEAPTLTQSNYRWYENVDALTPISAKAGEDAGAEAPAAGSILRLRINLTAGVVVPTGATFKLQYSNSTSSGFVDLTTSTAWIFYDNPSVADGQIIVDNVLSGSNVGESYGESNPSAATPVELLASQAGEWDWVLKNNSADTGSGWFFRMIFSSGTVLDSYGNFPALSAVTPTPTPTSTPAPIAGGGALISPRVSPPPDEPTLPKSKPLSPCDDIRIQKVDLSGDCRVDLVDLSILLYYYGKKGAEISRYDFNDNFAVDFPDVSVMMFYWTG